MPQKKCNKNCLECKLPKCLLDISDERAAINKKFLEKDKKRHAEYYKTHRDERLEKQKEYDKKYRNAEKCHAYYMKHKAEINKKNQERYASNREARLQQAKEYYQLHKEEISERRKLRRKEKKVG